MLSLQITLIFIAIAAIIIFMHVYSYDKNKISLYQPLDKKDKSILLLLLTASLLIFFVRMSSTSPYKSRWEAKKPGDKLVLTFDKPEHVAKIFYEVGYTKGIYSIYSTMNSKKTFIKNSDSKLVKDLKNMTNNSCVECFRYVIFTMKDLVASSIIFEAQEAPINLGKVLVLSNTNKIIKYHINRQNMPNLMSIDKLEHNFSSEFIKHNLVYDEVYYVSSAYEYINNIPPNVVQHPQLAILLTAYSSKIFGFSPFGWRIIPNILGILMILIIYLFAKRMFNNHFIAFSASLLLLIDPMHLAVTRFAFLDGYATFFILLEYYFLWKYYNARLNNIDFKISSINLLYTGIFFALASASKWNALFSIIAILIIIFYCEFSNNNSINSKLFLIGFVNLILLPILIYVATYIPLAKIFEQTNIIKFVYALQFFMFHVMNNMPHGIWIESRPWQWLSNNNIWPLDINPFISSIKSQKFFAYYYIHFKSVTLISLFLNPCLLAIFWIVFISLVCKSFFKKDPLGVFILAAIFAQYFPYFLFKRYGYIYYFYSVEPFIILGIAFLFNLIKQVTNNSRKIIFIFLAINIILFIWFSPIIFNLGLSGKIIMLIYYSVQPITLLCTAIALIYGFFIFRKYYRQ